MAKMRKISGKTASRLYGMDSMKKGEERLIFPHLDIDTEYLPEARNWQNGNTYDITLRVKQTSIREDERGGSAGFDIVGVSVEDAVPVKKGKLDDKKVDSRYNASDDESDDEDEEDDE